MSALSIVPCIDRVAISSRGSFLLSIACFETKGITLRLMVNLLILLSYILRQQTVEGLRSTSLRVMLLSSWMSSTGLCRFSRKNAVIRVIHVCLLSVLMLLMSSIYASHRPLCRSWHISCPISLTSSHNSRISSLSWWPLMKLANWNARRWGLNRLCLLGINRILKDEKIAWRRAVNRIRRGSVTLMRSVCTWTVFKIVM